MRRHASWRDEKISALMTEDYLAAPGGSCEKFVRAMDKVGNDEPLNADVLEM